MTRNDPTTRRGDGVAATALAAGATYAAAARQVGLSERTIKRRMSDPAFRALVNEIQVSTIEVAVYRLSHLSTEAIDTLGELIQVEWPAQVRLSAARTVLETALRWHELVQVERRLNELEARTMAGEPR